MVPRLGAWHRYIERLAYSNFSRRVSGQRKTRIRTNPDARGWCDHAFAGITGREGPSEYLFGVGQCLDSGKGSTFEEGEHCSPAG